MKVVVATLQVKEARKENKKRKHLRGSREIVKKKKNWKKMEGKWKDVEVIRELETDKFQKLSTFQIYEFFSLCSGQLWQYETNETNLVNHFTGHFLIQFVHQRTFWWK